MKQFKNVKRIYKIINRSLFQIYPTLDYTRLIDCTIALVEVIKSYDDPDCEIWEACEFSECSLDEFIVGAYWHFTEWHGGQYSLGYKALCVLGSIYTPNMETVNPDNFAYEQLNNLAEEHGETHE